MRGAKVQERVEIHLGRRRLGIVGAALHQDLAHVRQAGHRLAHHRQPIGVGDHKLGVRVDQHITQLGGGRLRHDRHGRGPAAKDALEYRIDQRMIHHQHDGAGTRLEPQLGERSLQLLPSFEQLHVTEELVVDLVAVTLAQAARPPIPPVPPDS